MKNIKVSICCITYNHEPFIRECLDGFLMQQCDFDYEIIINDDASTDGTREILLEYQKKHPDKIILSLQEENQYQKGVRGMFIRFVFPRAKGKYIALCEGDDYWTDPLKLQKQVDFLEKNEDYMVCFHNVLELAHDGNQTPSRLNRNENKTFTILDLAKGNLIHTPSVIYRKIFDSYPPWLPECPAGDYPLHMLHAEKGKIYCIAENMAVYRKGVGIWSSQERNSILLNWLKVQNLLLNHFQTEPVKGILEDSMYQHAIELIEIFAPNIRKILKSKNWDFARKLDFKDFIKLKLLKE